jgi:hypothetical protein
LRHHGLTTQTPLTRLGVFGEAPLCRPHQEP